MRPRSLQVAAFKPPPALQPHQSRSMYQSSSINEPTDGPNGAPLRFVQRRLEDRSTANMTQDWKGGPAPHSRRTEIETPGNGRGFCPIRAVSDGRVRKCWRRPTTCWWRSENQRKPSTNPRQGSRRYDIRGGVEEDTGRSRYDDEESGLGKILRRGNAVRSGGRRGEQHDAREGKQRREWICRAQVHTFSLRLT